MFLTILEDGGKITRFWGELSTRTHHVKLPWENQFSLNSTPVFFRVFHWDILRSSWIKLPGETGVSWIQKYIVGNQRNTWFKHRSSPSKIYGFNDYFYLKQKIRVAVNTNINFKFEMSHNENQVEINYRKTPNKTNSKLKWKWKAFIASAKFRNRFSSLTHWQQNL